MTLVSLWALQPVGGLAKAAPIVVDRQEYVSDTGPDAYTGTGGKYNGQPDPIDIHVATVPSQMTYHSLLHVALDALPGDASVQQLTVRLVPTADSQRSATENVNTGQAVIDAFPLKTELAANFNPSSPPAIDDSGPEVVGKLNPDNSWSFDLSKMVPYWKQHGNTGLAVVPNAKAATAPWSVGFDKTLTTANTTYSQPATTRPGGATNPAPAQAGTQYAPVVAPGGTVSEGGPSFAQGPQPGALNSEPSAPAAAPATPPPGALTKPNVAANNGQPGGGGTPAGTVPIWMLVLAASVTATVALLAQPISQALGAASGIGTGLLSQVRLHPRMFAVAGGLMVWSSTLGVYANTMGRNTLGPSTGTVANGGTAGAQDGGTPSADGTPSANPSDNGASGGGASGGNGSTSRSTTGSGNQPLTGAAVYQNNPNVPHPPAADLFGPSDNTVGITNNRIQMCAHAALTFGPAFNIGASDLNVFWRMVNDQGGIWGRKVLQPDGTPGIPFVDDGYSPSKAVTAAQTCQDQQGGDFLLLGGIGFDQIPAVRLFAEQHHLPYIHHIATQAHTEGFRYSYTMLPTLEQIGTQYGQFYVGHHAGAKLGIIYRNSSNWDPGRAAFDNYLKQAGRYGDVVKELPVNNNQGDYSAEISQMQLAGIDTVFIYENALAAEQFIQQSHNQNWNPKWIMFPFNLTLNTLAQAQVDTSRMDGVIPWPAYTCNASNDARYGAYKAELKKFEAAYHQYDSGANLCGDGGDLLFGTWLAWEQVYDLLYQCGPSCTRNNVAGLMQNGYHATVGANCAVDFRGTDGHHGGGPEDVDKVETVNGNPAWVTTTLCAKDLR
jgi:ABC-type branched-subunit amino acid transport system substrate-binding protein